MRQCKKLKRKEIGIEQNYICEDVKARTDKIKSKLENRFPRRNRVELLLTFNTIGAIQAHGK